MSCSCRRVPVSISNFHSRSGKKWDLDYTAVIAGRSTPIKSKAEVTKLEDVTTPAGSFRAFKIERLDTGAGKLRWDRVYYYSPQTGSIVKYHLGTASGHEHDIELVKFGAPR